MKGQVRGRSRQVAPQTEVQGRHQGRERGKQGVLSRTAGNSEKASAKRVRSPGMLLCVGRSGRLCPNPHYELSHCQEQPGKRVARHADSNGLEGVAGGG